MQGLLKRLLCIADKKSNSSIVRVPWCNQVLGGISFYKCPIETGLVNIVRIGKIVHDFKRNSLTLLCQSSECCLSALIMTSLLALLMPTNCERAMAVSASIIIEAPFTCNHLFMNC